ncbi:hypothetical protein [Mycobacteroides chelonae]|uniref:hypothetical protein n=1 Tax=Mycobacteroides chelonae TaxID=1774 RepID=UPI0039E98F36
MQQGVKDAAIVGGERRQHLVLDGCHHVLDVVEHPGTGVCQRDDAPATVGG